MSRCRDVTYPRYIWHTLWQMKKWNSNLFIYFDCDVITQWLRAGQITRKPPADVSFSDNFGGKVTGSQSSGVTRDHQEEPPWSFGGDAIRQSWTNWDKVGQIIKYIYHRLQLVEAGTWEGRGGRYRWERDQAGQTDWVSGDRRVLRGEWYQFRV